MMSNHSTAQQVKKTKVRFDCTCNDAVGAKYATAFRDLLATSPRFQPTSEFVEGKGSDATWFAGIRVVSLDPSRGDVGETSVIAVTFTFGPMFLDIYVQTCGSDPKGCAQNTFAEMDKAFSN